VSVTGAAEGIEACTFLPDTGQPWQATSFQNFLSGRPGLCWTYCLTSSSALSCSSFFPSQVLILKKHLALQSLSQCLLLEIPACNILKVVKLGFWHKQPVYDHSSWAGGEIYSQVASSFLDWHSGPFITWFKIPVFSTHLFPPLPMRGPIAQPCQAFA
jgi:hypothetical protein